jgi:hypothetical protein
MKLIHQVPREPRDATGDAFDVTLGRRFGAYRRQVIEVTTQVERLAAMVATVQERAAEGGKEGSELMGSWLEWKGGSEFDESEWF